MSHADRMNTDALNQVTTGARRSTSKLVPCVIACGYKSIQIPKTGHHFPAWLICLPPHGNYYFRSKRDFLILFRYSRNKLKPPKAALDKLANKAPWKRPDLEKQVERHVDGQFLMNLHDDDELPNSYHVTMKKSLWQMDAFLQAVYAAATNQSNDDNLIKAWNTFCRPSHVGGLVAVESSLLNNVCQDDKKQDDESLTTITSVAASSQLGQYFCTKQNAIQLVNLALDWIVDQQLQHVVLLEPSCGHGQVVWTVLEQLQARDVSAVTDIIGCDLDPLAISTCESEASKRQYNITIEWRHGDFLLSKPSDVDLREDATVVCIGGPPYTSGAGSGANISTDLPQQFLDHCIKEWNAHFVSFILPQRCKKHPLEMPDKWICETHEMASSTFYFQGKTPVTQPSIIQTFQRH